MESESSLSLFEINSLPPDGRRWQEGGGEGGGWQDGKACIAAGWAIPGEQSERGVFWGFLAHAHPLVQQEQRGRRVKSLAGGKKTPKSSFVVIRV